MERPAPLLRQASRNRAVRAVSSGSVPLDDWKRWSPGIGCTSDRRELTRAATTSRRLLAVARRTPGKCLWHASTQVGCARCRTCKCGNVSVFAVESGRSTGPRSFFRSVAARGKCTSATGMCFSAGEDGPCHSIANSRILIFVSVTWATTSPGSPTTSWSVPSDPASSRRGPPIAAPHDIERCWA